MLMLRSRPEGQPRRLAIDIDRFALIIERFERFHLQASGRRKYGIGLLKRKPKSYDTLQRHSLIVGAAASVRRWRVLNGAFDVSDSGPIVTTTHEAALFSTR